MGCLDKNIPEGLPRVGRWYSLAVGRLRPGGSDYPQLRAPCGGNIWYQSVLPGAQTSAYSHESALNEDQRHN